MSLDIDHSIPRPIFYENEIKKEFDKIENQMRIAILKRFNTSNRDLTKLSEWQDFAREISVQPTWMTYKRYPSNDGQEYYKLAFSVSIYDTSNLDTIYSHMFTYTTSGEYTREYLDEFFAKIIDSRWTQMIYQNMKSIRIDTESLDHVLRRIYFDATISDHNRDVDFDDMYLTFYPTSFIDTPNGYIPLSFSLRWYRLDESGKQYSHSLHDYIYELRLSSIEKKGFFRKLKDVIGETCSSNVVIAIIFTVVIIFLVITVVTGIDWIAEILKAMDLK